MKKNILTALCGIGLLMVVAPAHAYTYNFNATLSNAGLIPGNPGPQGWNVIMTSADNQNWNVTIQALGGANTPLDPANNIQFFFLRTGGTTLVTGFDPTAGSTTAGGAGNVAAVWSRNGANFNPTNATTGLLVATGQNPADFGLGPSGSYTSNVFTGSFATNNPFAQRFGVTVSGIGGYTYTSSLQSVAPEMPGAALLLVALLPLGFAVRKHMGVA